MTIRSIRSKIMTLTVNLGSQCNFNCTYCCNKNNNNSFDLNLLHRLYNFIDEYTENHKLLVSFWGGEPFVHFKVIEALISRYKNNKNVYFGIITNGFNISQKISTLPKESLKRLSIHVSYDYCFQNLNRKDGSNTQIIKNVIETSKLCKVKCVAHFTASNMQNVDKAFEEFLRLHHKYPKAFDKFRFMSIGYKKERYNYPKIKESLNRILKHKELDLIELDLSRNHNDCELLNDKTIFVDTNGEILGCHGETFLAEDKAFGFIQNMSNKDILETIDQKVKYFNDRFKSICVFDCDNEYCDFCLLDNYTQTGTGRCTVEYFDYMKILSDFYRKLEELCHTDI